MQYNPEQDRILLRINTMEAEEFRLFLTRRFVKALFGIANRLLVDDFKKREPEKMHVAGPMLKFEKERIISQANFSKSFLKDVKRFPLGEGAVLLSRIQVRESDAGRVLCLLPLESKGLELPVDNRFLQPFLKVLKDVVERAQWDFDFISEDRPELSSIAPPDRVLH